MRRLDCKSIPGVRGGPNQWLLTPLEKLTCRETADRDPREKPVGDVTSTRLRTVQLSPEGRRTKVAGRGREEGKTMERERGGGHNEGETRAKYWWEKGTIMEEERERIEEGMIKMEGEG